MIKPHWLPDWTDESVYPDLTRTSRLVVAWEFLRRNYGYQESYDKLKEVAATHSFINQIEKELAGTGVEKHSYYSGDMRTIALASLCALALNNLLKYKQCDFPPPIEYLQIAKIYHVFFPVDPASRTPPVFFETRYLTPRVISKDSEYKNNSSRTPTQLIVKFDVTLNIDQQVKRIEGLLKGYREGQKMPANRRSKRMEPEFSTYLRILDALLYKDSPEMRKQVAHELYGDSAETDLDKLRQAYKTAKQLMQTDYQKFTLTDSTPDCAKIGRQEGNLISLTKDLELALSAVEFSWSNNPEKIRERHNEAKKLRQASLARFAK